MISDAPPPGFLATLENYCRRLCEADWNDPAGPLQLRPDLQPDDLLHADFLQNTRLVLNALLEQKGTPVTATGNLNRAFVGQMLHCLALPALTRESILKINKVTNETDLRALHLVRVVAQTAGFIARRAKRFQVTQLGKKLLPEPCAGELYRQLFIAYFRRFNLNYDFNLRDVPGIQQSIAVILWRLDAIAADWTPVKNLAPQILLPRVLAQMRLVMFRSDEEEWIIAGYVLNPLLDFSLIERRRKTDWPGVTSDDFIRTTPLWRKFIHFPEPSPTSVAAPPRS